MNFVQKLVFSEPEFLDRLRIFAPVCFPEIFKHILPLIIFFKRSYQNKSFQVCGTPTYVAPEILAETGYGVKVDVWATGVIMYILLVGFPPFSSRTNNQEELFDQILSGLFEFNSPDWDDISYSAKELISWMLQVDPLQRYSAYEVLEHPWIKSCF